MCTHKREKLAEGGVFFGGGADIWLIYMYMPLIILMRGNNSRLVPFSPSWWGQNCHAGTKMYYMVKISHTKLNQIEQSVIIMIKELLHWSTLLAHDMIHYVLNQLETHYTAVGVSNRTGIYIFELWIVVTTWTIWCPETIVNGLYYVYRVMHQLGQI